MPNIPEKWTITIQAAFIPDLWVHHVLFNGEIGPLVGQDPDANFDLVPGLADERLFSIRAFTQSLPNHYLRHQDFRLKLQPHNPGDTQFEQDATFALVPSLHFLDDGSHVVSFRSFNFPDHYIRHFEQHLFLNEYNDKDDQFKQDASFRLSGQTVIIVK